MRKVDDRAKLDDSAIERALERLNELVKKRGLKSSATREAVARAALRRSGHFSVDELVQDLKTTVGVHPATVYRVLPLLVEAGLLRMTLVSLGEGARYERAFERDHHDHLICTSCGKVVEFEFEAIEVLQRDVAERFGFQLTDHVHELLGICEGCRAT